MTTGTPSVVVTRRLPETVETRLSQLFDVELRNDDAPMSRSDLVAAVGRCDVLVPSVTDRIDAGILARAGPRLKLIAQFGSGIDNLDVATARHRGIVVSNTPDVATEDTADMVIALMLAVSRRIPEGLSIMCGGDWTGWAPRANLGMSLTGKRLGILGMGRIGLAVARRAAAFGMAVDYHNRRRVDREVEVRHRAVWQEDLDRLVARADVISVNCPHTADSYRLLNARRIAMMKRDAIVINTSRGEVIDENALARALEAGRIGGAGLDVYSHTVEGSVRRLARLPNVVCLPQMGSATRESRLGMGEKVIINIKTFADGHRPPDQVIPDSF